MHTATQLLIKNKFTSMAPFFNDILRILQQWRWHQCGNSASSRAASSHSQHCPSDTICDTTGDDALPSRSPRVKRTLRDYYSLMRVDKLRFMSLRSMRQLFHLSKLLINRNLCCAYKRTLLCVRRIKRLSKHHS